MNANKILVLPGDGIGPEITTECLKILEKIEKKEKIKLEVKEGLLGGQAIDQMGNPLPPDTIKQLKEVDAVLLAAIGGPKWDNLPSEQRPEKGLLGLRKELKTFANLRPAKVFDCLADASSLKKEVISGVDLLVVRELTGGIYFGEPRGQVADQTFANTAIYQEAEIKRIIVCACQQAMKRSRKLCSIDKANVLEVSQFWREIAIKTVQEEFPEIELSHLYIDNAAMQLVKNPKQFDVLVSSNLFGDIISDEAAMLTGSIGLLPSASLGDGSQPGLFEPVHGSAPDIAGQDKANPIAMILSLAILLEDTYKLTRSAISINQAVEEVLKEGYRTADLIKPDQKPIGTKAMGDLIYRKLDNF